MTLPQQITFTHFGRDTYEVILRIEGGKADVRILGPDENSRLLLDPDAERYTFKHCWPLTPWGLWRYGNGTIDLDAQEAFGAALADEDWRDRLEDQLACMAMEYVPAPRGGHGG